MRDQIRWTEGEGGKGRYGNSDVRYYHKRIKVGEGRDGRASGATLDILSFQVHMLIWWFKKKIQV